MKVIPTLWKARNSVKQPSHRKTTLQATVTALLQHLLTTGLISQKDKSSSYIKEFWYLEEGPNRSFCTRDGLPTEHRKLH